MPYRAHMIYHFVKILARTDAIFHDHAHDHAPKNRYFS